MRSQKATKTDSTTTSNNPTQSFQPEQATSDIETILVSQQLHTRPDTLLKLQRTIGNRAVVHHLQSQGAMSPIRGQVSQGGVIQARLDGFDQYLADIDHKVFTLGNTWDKIVDAIQKYISLRNAGKVNDASSQIDTIETLTRSWLTSSMEKKAQEKNRKQEDIDKDKAKTSALKQLLVRLAGERQEVATAPDTPAYAPAQTNTNTPFTDHDGAMSTLAKVNYKSSPNDHFFSQEATFNAGTDNAGFRTGIPQQDPNYAGRAMAMQRIDQLLTAAMNNAIKRQGGNVVMSNMLVNTHFATNKMDAKSAPVPGIAMEKAQGKEMRKGFVETGNYQVPGSGMNAPANAMSFEDPVLMRGLNRLQVLDAICAQVDRHAANYFVNTSATGAVTGVQGIDNDMAFGQNVKDPNSQKIKDDTKDKAWRGLPPIIDADLYQGILSLQIDDIRKAITGLLAESEVEATISRFVLAKNHLQKFKSEDVVRAQEWHTRNHELAGKQTSENSYLGAARAEAVKATIMASPVQTQLQAYVMNRLQTTEKPTMKAIFKASNRPGFDFDREGNGTDYHIESERIAARIAAQLVYMVIEGMADLQMNMNQAQQVAKDFIVIAFPQIFDVMRGKSETGRMTQAAGEILPPLSKEYLLVFKRAPALM